MQFYGDICTSAMFFQETEMRVYRARSRCLIRRQGKDQGGQMAFLRFWAAYCECTLFLEILELFVVVDMDGSFPMNHSMQHLDSRFMS